jgi:hypothetical protein
MPSAEVKRKVTNQTKGMIDSQTSLSCPAISSLSQTVNALLFAKHGVPWFFLLPPLHLHCLAVFTANLQEEWIQQAQTVLVTVPWHPLSFLKQNPPVSAPIVFVHATRDILNLLPQTWWKESSILWFNTSSTSYPVPQLHYSVCLSHMASRGVSDSQWSFFSNKAFQAITPAPQRQVKHIIDRSIQTSTIANSRSSIPTVTECQLLQMDRLFSSFCCPTGYQSKDKTIIRYLSLGEICQILDIPKEALPPSLRSPTQINAKGLHALMGPLALQPPFKVLQQLFQVWTPFEASTPVNVTAMRHREANGTTPIAMYTPGSEFAMEQAYKQAIKADDAVIPIQLWNDRIWDRNLHAPNILQHFKATHGGMCPLDVLRSAMLRVWRVRLRRSFFWCIHIMYLHDWTEHMTPSLRKDSAVGADCMSKACQADWWEWRGGSTLFFWRWLPALRAMARGGHPIWVQADLPTYRRPQRSESIPSVHALIKKKLTNVLAKGYIGEGPVTSLTSFFVVP